MRALRLWAVMAMSAMVVFGLAACSPTFPLATGPALNARMVQQDLADEAHLQALQDIADANDGNRAAGTSGYEESDSTLKRCCVKLATKVPDIDPASAIPMIEHLPTLPTRRELTSSTCHRLP